MPSVLKNRAIIVLGMHRSGTSVFTGLLGLLGADLGPNLLAASSANEAGYWEHGKVVMIHERMLLELGSSWDDVSRLPEGWWKTETIAPFRAQLLELLAKDFGASQLWTLKDPRLCRLLPLWISILRELECEPVWVLMTRHPYENIRSLEKRNEFSWQKSELLWLQHTLDAERETGGGRQVVVTFDQLLDDWEATLGRVQQAIGQPWPITPEKAAAQVKEFIDPGKRHHRAIDSSALSWWTRETYEALLAGANGDPAAMRERLAPVQAGFDAADALFRPVVRERAQELEAQIAETNAKYAQLFDGFEEMKVKYRESKEKLAERAIELTARKELLKQFERSPGGKLNRLLGRWKKKKEKAAPSFGGVNFSAVEGRPEVSVIVDVGHDASRTARCFRALREQISGRNVEVLAVGDDATVKGLRSAKNLEVVSSGKTRVFAESHNRAAQKARGNFLIFLQDKVSPGEGWLDALIEPLHNDPEIGMAGPGAGLLKRDASVEMLPEDGQPREADFCTAACFAVSKNLFFQVGGFDGYYLPVEEASFGLKIRQTKHKVWQQPRCHITHHGPRHRFDAQRFDSNRKRFAHRWAEALARQP